MNESLNFPRKPLSLAVAIAIGTTPMIASAAAGRVEFAYGQVSIENASGEQKAAKKGTELESGDTITTERGRAQLRFTDGAFTSLQPKTSFKVEDYNYDGKEDGNERSFFSLFRGGLRTLTGAIGKRNRNAYRMKTPVATIGIRGTGYTTLELDDGSRLVLTPIGTTVSTLDDGTEVQSNSNIGGIRITPEGNIEYLSQAEAQALLAAWVDAVPERVVNDESLVVLDEEEKNIIESFLTEDDDPELASLEDGDDYAVAFAWNNNGVSPELSDVDFQDPVAAKFINNNLIHWDDNNGAGDSADQGELAFGPESDSVPESAPGVEDQFGWVRWVANGDQFNPPGSGMVQNLDGPEGSESISMVIGRPANLAAIMGGDIFFKTIGYTTPHGDDGSLGVFHAGALVVHLATNTVDGAVHYTLNKEYLLGFTGLNAPAGTFKGPASVISFNGGCAGSVGCTGNVAGVIVGNGPHRGGFAYGVYDPYNYYSPNTYGAVAFEQDQSGPNFLDFINNVIEGAEGCCT